MRKLRLKKQLSDEELLDKVTATLDTPECIRWSVLSFIQIGQADSANFVAQMARASKSRVYAIVQKYNKLGPDSLSFRPRGGRRRSLLSIQAEQELMHSLLAKAEMGLVKTALDIRQEVCQKTGFAVSDDYLWDLFRRHGWKKREMPRETESDVAPGKNARAWQPEKRIKNGMYA